MRLRLPELQAEDQQAQKINSEKQGIELTTEGLEDIDGVLHHQGLPYVPGIIRTELISKHHDNPLAGHFGIDKTKELIAWNYYWPTFQANVETYVMGSDMCLALKAVPYKPYGDLQFLPVPTH